MPTFHKNEPPDLRADVIVANLPFNISDLGRRKTRLDLDGHDQQTRAGMAAPVRKRVRYRAMATGDIHNPDPGLKAQGLSCWVGSIR